MIVGFAQMGKQYDSGLSLEEQSAKKEVPESSSSEISQPAESTAPSSEALRKSKKPSLSRVSTPQGPRGKVIKHTPFGKLSPNPEVEPQQPQQQQNTAFSGGSGVSGQTITDESQIASSQTSKSSTDHVSQTSFSSGALASGAGGDGPAHTGGAPGSSGATGSGRTAGSVQPRVDVPPLILPRQV